MKIVLADASRVIGSLGGTEKVLCNMANEMTERGHEVHVLCYENKTGLPFFPLNEKVVFKNSCNKNLYVMQNIKNLFVFNKKQRKLNRLKLLGESFAKEIHDIEPDVIVAYTRDACYAIKQYLHKDIPMVFMYHFDADTILADPLYHDAISSADCIQVLMPGDIEKTKQYITPKHAIVHIPNIVPQYDYITDYNKKVIINVGRISKGQKQQHYLIEAFGKLNKDYPDWKVELWGEKLDNDYVKELQEIINKYKIGDKVGFKGVTDNVPEKLANASIFAFPSSYEGFPLALTEAMSMGLPTLAFEDCPAVNEIVVDNSNGILVEQNLDAYTDGLEILMSNVELREKLGKQAKIDMKEYEPKKIWDKWESLLFKLSRK